MNEGGGKERTHKSSPSFRTDRGLAKTYLSYSYPHQGRIKLIYF